MNELCLRHAVTTRLALRYKPADNSKEGRDNVVHLVVPALATVSVYGTAVYSERRNLESAWAALPPD